MVARSTYLERYVSGEYEPVWAELQARGAAVYEEPLHSDALAVAHETMRRVRENLEMLIPRLAAIGYQFGYGWVQPPAYRPLDWQLRQEYLCMLARVKEQPALMTVHADVEARLVERQERLRRLRELGAPAIILANEERCLAELEAQPRATSWLGKLEEHIGALPLSVRAWYEVIGGVNLVGVHHDWVRLIVERGGMDMSYLQPEHVLEWGGHPMRYLEPLQVFPLSEERLAWILEALNLQRLSRQRLESLQVLPPDDQEPSAFAVLEMHRAAGGMQHLSLMANEHAAYLEQGSECYPYEIEVPYPCMDAPLLYERHDTTFVNYLRICLHWAGFPGWERLPVRPERDIATLTAGLLPF